jgi:predicted site-specific integrase-resolvase
MQQQSARPASSVATFPHRANAAGILQVFPRTISRWAQHGLLPRQRTLGGHRRYPTTATIEPLAASLTQEVRAA